MSSSAIEFVKIGENIVNLNIRELTVPEYLQRITTETKVL